MGGVGNVDFKEMGDVGFGKLRAGGGVGEFSTADASTWWTLAVNGGDWVVGRAAGVDWTERLEVGHVVNLNGAMVLLEVDLLLLLHAEEFAEESLPEMEGEAVAKEDREINFEEEDGALGDTDNDILDRLDDADDAI